MKNCFQKVTFPRILTVKEIEQLQANNHSDRRAEESRSLRLRQISGQYFAWRYSVENPVTRENVRRSRRRAASAARRLPGFGSIFFRIVIGARRVADRWQRSKQIGRELRETNRDVQFDVFGEDLPFAQLQDRSHRWSLHGSKWCSRSFHWALHVWSLFHFKSDNGSSWKSNTVQHCCSFCTNKDSRSLGIASFSNGNLTSSRFFEILNRDEFLRLSLRIFGTPAIGCTFVNAVCGGCGELKLEPDALRVLPLADESPWCWDKGERIVDFTAPALLLKGAANDDALLAEDSLPLVCKRHADGQREKDWRCFLPHLAQSTFRLLHL